jgi:hypothetical protein
MVHDLQGLSWKGSAMIPEYFALGKVFRDHGGLRLRIADYGLRITDCGLRILKNFY